MSDHDFDHSQRLRLEQLEYATLQDAPQSCQINTMKNYGEFRRASEADIWPTFLSEQFVEEWHNQAWLKVYLESILAWLHDLQDNELLDTSKPVYLLQLGACGYKFGLSLMHKLQQGCAEQGLLHIRLCLLIHTPSKQEQALLSRHPDFQFHKAHKRALIIDWGITSSISPLPKKAICETDIDYASNPAILIANGTLSQLAQSLYHVHYYEVYRADVARVYESPINIDTTINELDACFELPFLQQIKSKVINKDTQDNERIELAYQWTKVSVEDESRYYDSQLSERIKQLLEYQSSKGNSEVIAVPVQAARVINAIDSSFNKGILGLISDHTNDQKGLRLSSSINLVGMALPIDFSSINQLLCEDLSMQSGRLSNDETGCVMVLSEKRAIEFNYARHAFDTSCANEQPKARAQIMQSLDSATAALSDAQIRAFIVQTDHDVKVLKLFLPRLRKEGVPLKHRLAWCQLLSQVWDNYIANLESESFAFELGLLAVALNHWSLAKNCMLMCLEVNGPNSVFLHNLARVAWVTGELDIAQQSIDLAISMSEKKTQAEQLKNELLHYLQRCEKILWYDCEYQSTHHENSALKLLPLGEHQLGEYYTQYRNQDISERLRGIKLDSLEQLKQVWPIWQAQGDSNQKAHFAMVHAEFGLVGGVVFDFDEIENTLSSEEVDNKTIQSAHLSFWVGEDYQHKGFGALGVNLAIEQIRSIAHKLNITYIKTSAWCHNIPSRKILKNLGFIESPDTQGAGVEKEVFYEFYFNRNVKGK
ncbi:GNAT family N-acetyltransferase [Pseudoalteromonas luteoviolacea]|uniref:GNAT family N-acetyltransferase n=1 Tax=Pseudoalteromonas luteoviolacea TaxID=43657 RepID=UPI001B3A55E4|nr:GNAT family N-acetyltransferase [Pseudoalteromonas luteoviolacea]MBQ4877216.1 GNAT family N-acetyltransferase [Pseudoalteromonas luteoviolacea]MBQ4906077.1 GNAT family N-acetyltransferase [Pseudoalteromonas luteoviolacea]